MSGEQEKVYAQIIEVLRTLPEHLFRHFVDDCVSHCSNSPDQPIQVDILKSTEMTAEASRTGRAFLVGRRKYQIRVSQGFINYVCDLFELLSAQSDVVQKDGTRVGVRAFSQADFALQLAAAVLTLVKGDAWKGRLMQAVTRLQRSGAEAGRPASLSKDTHSAFWLQRALQILVAHEVAHITLGHLDDDTPTRSAEVEADIEAARIVARSLSQELDSSPPNNPSGRSRDEVRRVNAMHVAHSAAWFFGASEIAQDAAARLKLPWPTDYPDGVDRYRAFVSTLASELTVPVELFSRPPQDQVGQKSHPPDWMLGWMLMTHNTIDWSQAKDLAKHDASLEEDALMDLLRLMAGGPDSP